MDSYFWIIIMTLPVSYALQTRPSFP